MHNKRPPAVLGTHRDETPHFAGRKAGVSDLRKRLDRPLLGTSPEGIDDPIVNFAVAVSVATTPRPEATPAMVRRFRVQR